MLKKSVLKDKKNLFDSYSKKPLKDEVRKAMKRYFLQLDQKNNPIDVYHMVLNEVEPPLLDAVMKFSNDNQSKACLLYTSPSPRDLDLSRMPSSA